MTTTTNLIEIPVAPRPSEVWFYIDLSLIADIPGLYALVQALGFTPRLAYRWNHATLQVCLLLYHGCIPGLADMPRDLYEREQEILANCFDTDAIYFACTFDRKPARSN